MNVDRIARLKIELAEHVKAARAITDPVQTEGREFTAEERTQLAEVLGKAKEAKTGIDTARTDAQTLAYVRELGALGGLGTKARTGRVSSAWAKSAAEGLHKLWPTDTTGQKAVLSGTVGVPSPISSLVPLAQPERVIDLLVGRTPMLADGSGDSFQYVRQTVRTNNAAEVADNATKPTSVYTIQQITDTVRVVAHLSEAMPNRYLTDIQDLAGFLDDEMMEGVFRRLETQCLAGDGSAPNLRGILATSGILAQAFATDLVTTLRKARTAMAVIGEQPSAYVMNPADTETLDLVRTETDGPFLLDVPNRGPVFGNLPIVESVAVPAGTAVLANWNFAQLVVRENVNLASDTSGVLFTKNQVVLRAEGRFGLAVLRPSAFCSIDLSA